MAPLPQLPPLPPLPPLSPPSRRAVLGAAAGAGLLLVGGGARPHAASARAAVLPDRAPKVLLPARPGLVAAENARTGSAGWRLGPRTTSDTDPRIKVYAADSAVPVGGRLRLKVSTAQARPFAVEIYRLGDYGGTGGRLVSRADGIPGTRQAPAHLDRSSGTVTCAWSDTWQTDVPDDWLPGLYTAVLADADDVRTAVPFVVTDLPRAADYLVVLPTTTYQAYNEYPVDGATGRSLYYGQDPATRTSAAKLKARVVSFDRPYAGAGLPQLFELDHAFVRWAEARGYDLAYATSADLHAGRVDLRRYKAVVFPGHDEYWSQEMRARVEAASEAGVGLAFLTANNVYWHVRMLPGADGTPDRLMRCNKDASSSHDRADPGPTVKWRDLHRPEQELLGVQYVSVVKGEYPMGVRESGHWFWSGTGLRDGDALPGMVWGEADRRFDEAARPRGEEVFLAGSPYRDARGGAQRQQTGLYRAASGGLVFTAGTFRWPQALGDPRYADPRVGRATENLFAALVAR
ncbi:N,N-dimethylformamidase beta subunit family domain-containing protein [Uniformispora flossi]|uniref:N,N-dimethylformamidase beta subunit family domain-containing protein n=1 Tax=Uniformispora flossi TaxID=3390723 RepID=UPI003C2CBC49